MTRRRLERRFFAALTLSLAVLAVGCNAPQPTGPSGAGEDTLKRAKGGTASLPVLQARELRLKSRDGKLLNGVVVQIGGKNLLARDGLVRVPEEAWLEAQKLGKLVVIGAGFLPLTIPLDGEVPAELLLTPTGDLGKPGIVSKAGGTLASAEDQALITIPSNLLTGGDTPITVGTYQPTLDGDVQAAFNRDVAAFLEAHSRATGGATNGLAGGANGGAGGTNGGAGGANGGAGGAIGGVGGTNGGAGGATGGVAGGASSAAACGAPFVCGPVTAGLGVSVTIDGPIQAGQLTVSLDLAKLMRGWDGNGSPPASFSEAEKSDAIAAARILETFRNFDATNDPSWRETMRTVHGVTLDHTLLTFPVKLGDVSAVGGLARVEVDGLNVLGARLEVTVISADATARAGALSEAIPVSPGDVPLSMIRSKVPDYVESARVPLTNGGAATPDNGPDAIMPLVTNGGGNLLIHDDDTATVFTPAQLLTNNGGALISNATGAVALIPNAGTGLISDHNGGVISQNGGGLIANNSGGVISQNGGGLIANNSGGVISQNGGGLIANNSGGVISQNGGSFIGNNAGGLVGNNIGSLIANNSGGLIGNNAGGLVSNNSGGFKAPTITGYPFFPFEPPAGKFQLLQIGPPVPNAVRETATGLLEYLWPGQTRVRAIMANGAPLTEWERTSGGGEFSLELPEAVPIVFFLQCELLVRGEDNLPRMAYSMAFAPGKKGTTDVAVDASTTMVATSTLHLLDYIPPEYQRLTGLAESFEKKVKDVADSLPEGVDLNKVAGGTGGGKRPYQVLQVRRPRPFQVLQAGNPAPSPSPTLDPKVAAAVQQIQAMNATLSVIEGRVAVLGTAWDAFNPFLYGKDLGDADRTVTEASAVRISHAASLRGAYDPMYGFATANAFRPASYQAINPDSPPETYQAPIP